LDRSELTARIAFPQITDIARAAEVSRRTLFAYFPTKEDLVPPDALRRRDPSNALNDDPEIMAFLTLINGIESLAARLDALYLTRRGTLWPKRCAKAVSIRSPRAPRRPR
jgi:hypothetical protein